MKSLNLCDPMDCSLQGSSVHGIFQVRILEWVAVSFSRRSSQPKDLNPGLPHCRQTLFVTRVCVPRFCVSSQQRFGVTDIKAPSACHSSRVLDRPCYVIVLRSRTDRVIALRPISVTALFYLEDSRKIHLQGVRAHRSKDSKRRAP